MNDFDEMPADLRGTVAALRRQAGHVPAAALPVLDDVVLAGRGRVRRRRLAGAGAGAAVLALAAAVAVGVDADRLSGEGPPAAPGPDGPRLELQERDVTEVYATTEQVMADAGLQVQDVSWSAGGRPLWGPLAREWSDTHSAPGFEEEDAAWIVYGDARLTGGKAAAVGVQLAQVHGGISLERDYCEWYAVGAPWEDVQCEQVRTDDGGLLVRELGQPQVTYLWPEGQVQVTKWQDDGTGLQGPGAAEITVETLEEIATDPRLRW